MFVRADTVLSQVDLETVTPEEALSIVQQLPADILHSAHFTSTRDCSGQWRWWLKLRSGTRESRTALRGCLFERRPLCP